MSDWEDQIDAGEVTGPVLLDSRVVSSNINKWSDTEDAGEDVLDAWDASEDEAPAPVRAPVPAAVAVKKKESHAPAPAPTSAATKKATKGPAKAETPAETKARLQREVLRSDAQNVADLFSGISNLDISELPTIAIAQPPSQSQQAGGVIPREYFDELSATTLSTFAKVSSHGFYVHFLEGLTKKLMEPLKVEEIRKMSTMLNALANEKMRQEKAAQKKKKTSTKQQLKYETSDIFNAEDANYDDGANGYDDFM